MQIDYYNQKMLQIAVGILWSWGTGCADNENIN